MRVTNRMMVNSYLNDMNYNLTNINKINNQLATGKEINRPSDNPIKAAKSLSLNTSLSANAQYKQNIIDTNNYLDTVDEALYQIGNSVSRIRELMIAAGNAAYGSSERAANRDEIEERVKEISQILNSSFDGKYIFGGTKTDSKPVTYENNDGTTEIKFLDKDGKKISLDTSDEADLIVLKNIGSTLNVEISQGVTVDYNVNAMQILKFQNDKGEDVDVINLLSEIQNNLISTDPREQQKVLNENLNSIDDVITNLLTLRSSVGAKQNRMESAQNKNEDENLNMTEILSSVEDIDFTQKTIEYSMVQTTYMAALQVSAKVLPKSLLDYL
ncbi:MAG: flagellar hook-associated protein FlgL [Clostridiaceae bacterium]|nr:flagellar hook-associated protein FlgL [Clostridiaceae bacterium]